MKTKKGKDNLLGEAYHTQVKGSQPGALFSKANKKRVK